MKSGVQKKPFSNIEISSFCGQFALILKSGISSFEGISIMMEDAASSEEGEILHAMLETLQESGSLHQAFSQSGLFPSYMLHMVEIGEETGTLDEVMSALSHHYLREDSIAKSIRNSITYPSVIAGMMVVVIVVLLVKVMPIFNQVFIQLGTEMTGFSKTLMSLGTAINRYSVLLAALLFLCAAFLLYGTKTTKGKQLLCKIGYKFRFTRKLFEEIAACRFASGMSLTLSSGLNPERCMELVSALNEDVHFQGKINLCQEMVAAGESLSDAFCKSGVFSGMYARMVSIGNKTGTLDQVMAQVAELYQEDIDTSIGNKLSVLEPTLVITLSVIVGAILLSVMFPLMGIMSNL